MYSTAPADWANCNRFYAFKSKANLMNNIKCALIGVITGLFTGIARVMSFRVKSFLVIRCFLKKVWNNKSQV